MGKGKPHLQRKKGRSQSRRDMRRDAARFWPRSVIRVAGNTTFSVAEAEAAERRADKVEISIPPGPRLGDRVVDADRVVKGFGQEEQEIERVEEASGFLYASRVRAVRLMARFNPALQAVPSLGQVGVLALGGWLAIHGSITLGTFLAFSAYLAQMSGPVRTLTMMITIGQEARASVIRVFEIIDSRELVPDLRKIADRLYRATR